MAPLTSRADVPHSKGWQSLALGWTEGRTVPTTWQASGQVHSRGLIRLVVKIRERL